MNPNTTAPIYSYNTGQRLQNGQPQDKFNTSTGQQIGNPINIPNATPISPTVNASLIGESSRLSLPQLPTNTTATGIIAGTGSAATQSQAQIQQAQQNVAEVQKAQGASKADTAQSDIIKAAREALNMENSVLTNQANQEASEINPIQKTLNDINTQIADQQIAYRAEQDKIRNTPMSIGQSQVNQNAIEDTYGRRLADLAIRQSAAQGNIDSIRSNFERQTKLLIQPYENELKFQQTFAQKYADSLSAKENKQLELVMEERKNLIQQTKELQSAKASMVAEIAKNGGGADQTTIQAVQNADNLVSIAEAGSKYIGKMDFLQARANIRQSEAATAVSYANLDKIKAETDALKLPTITNPQARQYAGALSVILGSAKFTKDQKNAVIRAINSGDDPLVVVKNQAKNILGQTEATKVTNFEVAKNSLQDIDNSLKQFYAKGGETGLFKGNYEKVINNLGKVKDPELVDLATQIQAGLQIYRNAVSGTAYSTQEGTDINRIFPGINKAQGLNEAIIKGRIKAFDSTIDGSYKSALGSTYTELIDSAKADVLKPQLQKGEILIIRNGQTGAIPEYEFNPKTDKKL
jgi:hypothetical protein